MDIEDAAAVYHRLYFSNIKTRIDNTFTKRI
jgi:hypothetical protein